MKNYQIEERTAFNKPYLSIDLTDLNLLEEIQQQLSNMECVKKVNISDGKRQHLTVYIWGYYDFEEAKVLVTKFMDGYDETKNSSSSKINDLSHQSNNSSSVNFQSNSPVTKNDANKFTVKSQLDNIPNDKPVVFISYAWDDDEHKKWVRKLSDDLRQRDIFTLLDDYEPDGTDLPAFMLNGIQKAQKVLVIGSPRYKEKLDAGKPSGVTFEDQIINTQLYWGNKTKFIPVLAKGTFETSFSIIMGVKKGRDMSTLEKYNKEIDDLAASLKGTPTNVAPELGTK